MKQAGNPRLFFEGEMIEHTIKNRQTTYQGKAFNIQR